MLSSFHRESADQFILIRWIFIRLLAVIYGIAFLSFWMQVDGLIGSQGIMPAEQFLSLVQEQLGWDGYVKVPTVFWLAADDWMLRFVCLAGVASAVLVTIGICQGPLLLLLWGLYLSLGSVGDVFLSFQWDILLLEAGFLAVWFAPWSVRPAHGPPSLSILWLLRWLLFRLILMSGIVKLTSGDPSWRDLTALTYHYETQPLPSWTAWYVHQMPEWFHSISALIMFGIELLVPLTIFMPRRIRIIGCLILILFQTGILITGSYTFFNWLAILLCITLLDDKVIKKCSPVRLMAFISAVKHRIPDSPSVLKKAIVVITPCILLISSIQFIGILTPLPEVVREPLRWVGPFRTINTYGLFAIMTTVRPEIFIEGSQDGDSWHEYTFKWKPGDIEDRPSYPAPHQPRLDWQMWFAALGTYQNNPWLLNCMVRLMEGSAPVIALFRTNPFPDTPPRYIRAVVYDYTFTTYKTGQETDAWWKREYMGLYTPVLKRPESEIYD